MAGRDMWNSQRLLCLKEFSEPRLKVYVKPAQMVKEV